MTTEPCNWYLSISTFTTYSPGASHWYGEVGRDHVYRDVTQLVRVLDAAAAKKLSDPDFTFHPGDDTERFDTRDAVLAAAITYFHKAAQPGDQLFLGRDLGQPDRTLLAVNPTVTTPTETPTETPPETPAGHVPAPPITLGESTGLIYCKRCGRLLSSDRAGTTTGAAKPCRDVHVTFR